MIDFRVTATDNVKNAPTRYQSKISEDPYLQI
jgi:hypothetical protein